MFAIYIEGRVGQRKMIARKEDEVWRVTTSLWGWSLVGHVQDNKWASTVTSSETVLV